MSTVGPPFLRVPRDRGRVEHLVEAIVARRAYFQALKQYRPEMLDALRTNALPHYSPKSREGGEHPLIAFEPWGKVANDPRHAALAQILLIWMDQFRVSDSWITDVALSTLYTYWPGFEFPPPFRPPGENWHWIYMPTGRQTHFQVSFQSTIWFPPTDPKMEEWDAFRDRIEAQLRTALKAYRREQERTFNGSDKLFRDAQWTVRYQKGEMAHQIASTLDGPYKDGEQTVYRTIARFAASIGLTLRKARPKPTAKRKPTTVSSL